MTARAAMEHLDPDTLAAYVDGRLAAGELGRADRHIDSCQTCRHELSALAAVHSQPSTDGGGARPEEDRLGRYVVMRELGRGAMGLVVRAYDPELDRPVAIKLLHHVDAETRERLRREAQAMARLRHPNVVTVYDVVADGEAMFVAMELVDGDTLRGFCRGRAAREILEACVRAGRGLAAAHDARLVHRDFKPENVLCGEGGEVRVSDFGLARVDDAPADDASAVATTIAGTPAYMAPEIYRREPATPRSDQFSFCVTTYEMLAGRRPFEGGDARTLRAAILAGEPAAPPSGSVPARVWRVLRRGLARDPADRYPSMHALLAALVAATRARRRRWLAAGVAVTLAAAGTIAWAGRGSGRSCAIDDRALGDAWDAARHVEVAGAVARAGGEETSRRVVAALDAYANAWVGERRDACEATNVRGEQSALALDRRIACLARGRRELDALAGLLADADAQLAQHAIEAIGRLPDPAACTSDAGPAPDAADPVHRAIEDLATAGLDRAYALQYAGKLAAAGAAVDAVIAGLGTRDEPRLLGEALLIRARTEADRNAFDRSVATLYDALHAAERAHDDALVATVWVEIVLVTGAQQHRFDLALANARAADAALARIQPPVDLQIRYDYALGTVLLAQGKAADARARLQAGLALVGDRPRRDAQAGMFQSALCGAELQLGALAAAHDHCAKALALLEAALGPDHLKVAITLNSVGAVALREHDLVTAERSYRRAAAIFERQHATDQVTYALALSNLGAVFSERDDIADAQVQFERARDAFAAHHPDHPQRLYPLQGLGNIALARGDLPGAIHYLGEARTAIASIYAADSAELAIADYNLALAYQQNHQLAQAQALLDEIVSHTLVPGHESWMLAARALDLLAMLARDRHDLRGALALSERALAAIDHAGSPTDRAYISRALAEVHLALHEPALAIAPAEDADRYDEAHPDPPYELGVARWTLALALWDSGRDRARAIALAKAAADAYAKATSGINLAALRRQVADFLRAHEKS